MPLKPVRAFQILSRTSAESVEEVAPVVDMTKGASRPDIPIGGLLDALAAPVKKKTVWNIARSKAGCKPKRKTKEERAAMKPPPEGIRTNSLARNNAEYLPTGVIAVDADGKLVRTIENATADEIIAYVGGKGPVVILGKKNTPVHPRTLMTTLRKRADWETLRAEIKLKYPALLSGKGLRKHELDTRSEEAAEAATTAIQNGYVPPLLHRSQAIHDPEKVADALEVSKFGANERIKLLLDIAYDESLRGSDRLQALEIIDKTVIRCGRAIRAAQSSDWNGVVERSVMEGVIRGDKSSLEIAIASGKAEGFKLPERTSTPSTAVQVNVSGASVDPFAGLSPEKRARLTEIDVMLGQAPLPVIDQTTETTNANAYAGQDISTT